MRRFGKVVSYKKLKTKRIGYSREGIDEGAEIVITDVIEHPRSVKHRFILLPSIETRFNKDDIVWYKPKNGRIQWIDKITEGK